MKKLISGGVAAFVIALIGLLYNMNMLPVTAETLDEHIQDEQKKQDQQDKKDARQDLGFYYMQRREVRNELSEAEADKAPDLEEELAQINDNIDLAKTVLEEKD